MAAVVSGCSGSGEGSEPPNAPLVRAFVVAQQSDGDTAYTGTVRARIESQLGFRVPGQIVSRSVNEGDTVSRGQALMRIDPADFALGASAANDRLRAAEAEAARAAADEERLRGLVEAGAISASSYDSALAAKRATAANVSSLRAQLAEARNSRRYTVLRADAAGTITDVMAEPGQVVSPGMPVMVLAQSGEREAVVEIPEDLVSDLPREATASIYGTDTSSSALLREISGAADPLTRTFTARYTLTGDAARARIGSTVSIRFARSGQSPSLTVPLGALHKVGDRAGVWKIGKDGRTAFVEVTINQIGEELAQISSAALKPGTRIVALGADRLRANQQVRIMRVQGL